MTRAEVRFQLSRLLEVFPSPKHYPADPDELARIYGVVLEPYDVQAVADGVTKLLAGDGRFFPTPGVVATAAGHRRSASKGPTTSYVQWEQTWGRREVTGPDGEITLTSFTDCPVCGAVPAQGKRLQVRHIAQRHRDRGQPVIGWSDEAEAFYANVPRYEPNVMVARKERDAA